MCAFINLAWNFFLRCAFSYASSDHETLCKSSCIACRQKVSRRCVKACDTSYYCSDCKNSCTVYKQRAFLQCEWACESSAKYLNQLIYWYRFCPAPSQRFWPLPRPEDFDPCPAPQEKNPAPCIPDTPYKCRHCDRCGKCFTKTTFSKMHKFRHSGAKPFLHEKLRVFWKIVPKTNLPDELHVY